MSIDLNWETLTAGPDGQELAHQVRDFIHRKFQSVPLPRFIKSVTVHDFQFGSIPPDLELKDITDPLPDFYEGDPDLDDDDNDDNDGGGGGDDSDDDVGNDDGNGHGSGVKADALRQTDVPDELRAGAERRSRLGRPAYLPPYVTAAGLRSGAFATGPPSASASAAPTDLGSPFLGVSTPGMPGGASTLHYFHSQFASGLSGSQTPLAAVAGAHHLGAHHSFSSPNLHQHQQRHDPAASAGYHSRNPSQGSSSVGDTGPTSPPAGLAPGPGAPTPTAPSPPPPPPPPPPREHRVEDMQAVFRVRYAGDVRLLLTADILLDYPMPSFVGIPVRLSVTGLTFDGVGVVAYVRRKVHFCFLSPEDAAVAVGADDRGAAPAAGPPPPPGRLGGLLQEIRVESEIGGRDGGRQSLKNVGKVERFVLEQVRRIFEEEFVYPSFWTFLV